VHLLPGTGRDEFLAHYPHVLRSHDPKSNPIPGNLNHADGDVIVEDDAFRCLSGQYQHLSPPLLLTSTNEGGMKYQSM
jgi:hypothetical protein